MNHLSVGGSVIQIDGMRNDFSSYLITDCVTCLPAKAKVD